MKSLCKYISESIFSTTRMTSSELRDTIIRDILKKTRDIAYDEGIIDEKNINMTHDTLIITPPNHNGLWIKVQQPMNDALSSYGIKKLRIDPPLDKKSSSVGTAYIYLDDDISNYNLIGNLQECNFMVWAGHIHSMDKGFNGTTFIADKTIEFDTFYGDNNVKFECEHLALCNYLRGNELTKCRQGCFSGKVKDLFYFPLISHTINDIKDYLDLVMGTDLDKKEMDQYLTANASSAVGVAGWVDEYNLNANDIRKRLGIENIQAQQIHIALSLSIGSRRAWPKMIIFNIEDNKVTIDTIDRTGERHWWKNNYNIK